LFEIYLLFSGISGKKYIVLSKKICFV